MITTDGCLQFLEKQAKELGLPFKTYYCVPRKPIVIITWVGQDSDASSVLLNSHMDVVPVFEVSLVCTTLFYAMISYAKVPCQWQFGLPVKDSCW